MHKEYSVLLNGVNWHELTLGLTTSVSGARTDVNWELIYRYIGASTNLSKLLVKFNEGTLVDTNVNVHPGESIIASGTFSYQHFKDGSGKFPIYVYFERTDIEGAYAEINEEFVFYSEVYRPTISITGNKLGETLIADFGTDGTAMQRILSYTIDNTERHIGVYTDISAEFKLPENLCQYFTNSSYTNIKFTCGASNGKHISVAIPIYISDDTKPSCALTITDDSGYKDKYGKFIQSYSKPSIEVRAEGIYGSTITGYRTTVNGMIYTNADFVTDIISNSEDFTVSTTVTDSRGAQNDASQNVEVYAYNLPYVVSLKAQRCDAEGNPSEEGAYIIATFSGKVTSLDSQNSVHYQIEYINRMSGVSSGKKTLDITDYSVIDNTYIFEAATDSAYEIILYITDDFDTRFLKAEAPSVGVLWSKFKYNLGIALGKFVELVGVFDIGFKTRFYGGLLRVVLSDKTDLNDLKTPNVYSGNDIESAGYLNCPAGATGKFSLVVEEAGADGEIYQKLTTCSITNHVEYIRFYSGGLWGAWENTALNAHPIGNYYISHDPTSPAELFGGTWTKIGGRFLYAEGDATLNGQTGGYATVTLNESQMPAHTHILGQNGEFAYGQGWGNGGALSAYSAGTTAWYPSTSSTGGSQPHENMPPYIRVAVWRRIA